MANIGIDITALCSPNPGGIGSSLYESLRALEHARTSHRFFLYGTSRPYVPFTDRHAKFPWPVRIGSGLTARSNILWMQTGLNPLLRADAIDLFWGPRHVLPLRAPVLKVATVHDFWYAFHPEQQPWLNLTLNKLVTERTMRAADHVVAVSQATADDAKRLFGLPDAKVSVVPWGVDREHFRRAVVAQQVALRARYALDDRPFILAMDVFNPRKDFETTLHAFAALPPALRDTHDLVALGRPRRTARPVPVEELARELGLEGLLRLPGDIDAADLPALYSAASVLAFPSVYEGFGMPLLEAMACGCPAITADTSSLPEVAGDAALLVPPYDPRALAAALERVLTDAALAQRLREAGEARAAAFPWTAVAERMLAVFDRVLAS